MKLLEMSKRSAVPTDDPYAEAAEDVEQQFAWIRLRRPVIVQEMRILQRRMSRLTRTLQEQFPSLSHLTPFSWEKNVYYDEIRPNVYRHKDWFAAAKDDPTFQKLAKLWIRERDLDEVLLKMSALESKLKSKHTRDGKKLIAAAAAQVDPKDPAFLTPPPKQIVIGNHTINNPYYAQTPSMVQAAGRPYQPVVGSPYVWDWGDGKQGRLYRDAFVQVNRILSRNGMQFSIGYALRYPYDDLLHSFVLVTADQSFALEGTTVYNKTDTKYVGQLLHSMTDDEQDAFVRNL